MSGNRNLLLFFAFVLSVAVSCIQDEDCNLNGVCTSGACVCESAWRGSDCGELNLLPAPIAGAYNIDNNSSWGGGVVPDSEGYYHMYFSLMVNHCGLNTWTQNSEIAHGIAKSPSGPFEYVESVLAPWAHNTQPFLWNDTYLIFHVGCGTRNTSQLQQCVNGSTPSVAMGRFPSDFPCQDWAINVLVSKSVDGPWTEYSLFHGNTSVQPWPINVDNPSALIFPNGTTLLMFRSWYTNTTIGIATSPHPYLGPYEVPSRPIWSDIFSEDPFLWQDSATGHFHALFHAMQPSQNGTWYPGLHAYSRDAKNWTMSNTPAYGFEVEYDDGSSVTLGRRERPQLRFDPISGKPTHLYNGVQASLAIDKTFTLVTPINID